MFLLPTMNLNTVKLERFIQSEVFVTIVAFKQCPLSVLKVLCIPVTCVTIRQHDRTSLRLTNNLNMKVLNVHVTTVNIRQEHSDFLILTNNLNMKVLNIPVPNVNIRPNETFQGYVLTISVL